MPVALMKPSLLLRCQRVSLLGLILGSAVAHHEEVCFWMRLRHSSQEDFGATEVLRQRGSEVSVLESAQVLLLRSIGSAYLSFLHRELGLA